MTPTITLPTRDKTRVEWVNGSLIAFADNGGEPLFQVTFVGPHTVRVRHIGGLAISVDPDCANTVVIYERPTK